MSDKLRGGTRIGGFLATHFGNFIDFLKNLTSVTLSGDLSGSGNFDDNGNMDINVTVSQTSNADTLDNNHASAFLPAGTYNTVIGTDGDINTSGATIIDNLYMTDGVITSHGTRTLTFGDIGALATSGGAVTGNLVVNGMLDAHMSTREGGVRRIMNPKGGTYNNVANNNDGALRIRMPAHENTNSMLRMIVDVYNYQTNTSFTVTLGGYLYSSANWRYEFAIFKSTRSMTITPKVTFCLDSGGYGVVYIGDINDRDVWDYSVISVRELIIGYSGDDNAEWDDALNLSYSISYGTDVVKVTQAGKQLDIETVNGHKVSTGTSAPSSPSTNDIWIDTSG